MWWFTLSDEQKGAYKEVYSPDICHHLNFKNKLNLMEGNMYAALFELTGWTGLQQRIFEAESVGELFYKFNQIQDLCCLVRMGRARERKKGQKALDLIEELIEKYYDHALDIEDLLRMDVQLSIGSIKCVCVVEGVEEIDKLRAQYPNAK